MKEIFDASWAVFTAIAAGIALIVGLITNIDKLKAKWTAWRTARKKRKSAIVDAVNLLETLKTDVAAMKTTMCGMSEDVASLEEKINQIEGKVSQIETWNAEQSADIKGLQESVQRIDSDTGDLLCSQITREHDYYMTLGFCPDSDKRRLQDIYNRYKARGRNHVAANYLKDIFDLPNAPETK